MIAVICARSGSKRIKNKNIINFFGKPIIYYPIKIAKNNNLIQKIYVSTDSKKIKKIVEKYGAEVPYLRKKSLSYDNTPLKKALEDFCQNTHIKENYVCCIYSTSVLLNSKLINKAYLKIKRLKYDLILGVKEFETDPNLAMYIKNKRINFLDKKYYLSNKKRKKYYSDAGYFFIFHKKNFFKKEYLPKKTTYFILNNDEALDINYQKDLKLLKILFNKKHKNYFIR